MAYISSNLLKREREEKKNLNYITAADQPTDSRPPEATSATSTNIDRVPISFLHFVINMKLVHKSSLFYLAVNTPTAIGGVRFIYLFIFLNLFLCLIRKTCAAFSPHICRLDELIRPLITGSIAACYFTGKPHACFTAGC